MPYSMTGFGAAEGDVSGGRLRVEIRTVNHRYFHLAPKVPSDLAGLEGDLRDRLRKDFDRGHVSVSVRWADDAGTRNGGLELNLERAREAMARLRELQTAVGLTGEIPIDLLARQPDVFRLGDEAETTVPWGDLAPIVEDAVRECRAMRRREGGVLATELRERLEEIQALAEKVAVRAPERLMAELARLRAAVSALLEGRGPEDGRLAQEIAIIADKVDITEELVRLRAHVAAAAALLDGDQPVGKRLGFLAQELGREVNTIGSKANDAEISHLVVEMKGELEKLREQLENLE